MSINGQRQREYSGKCLKSITIKANKHARKPVSMLSLEEFLGWQDDQLVCLRTYIHICICMQFRLNNTGMH